MKAVYEPTITEGIFAVIYLAEKQGRHIKHIEVSKTEWDELRTEEMATHALRPGTYGIRDWMFNGIPIKVVR